MQLKHIYLLLIVIFFAVYLEHFWLAALLAALIVFGVFGTVVSKTGHLTGGLAKGLGEDTGREYAAFEHAHGHLPDPKLLPDMLEAAGAKTAEYWWNRKADKAGYNPTQPAQPYDDTTYKNTSKYLGSRLITGSTRFLDWLVNRVFHMGHFHGHEGELHKGVAAEAAAKGPGDRWAGNGNGGGGGGHGGGHGGH